MKPHRPVLGPSIRIARLEDGCVVLDAERDVLLRLNATAAVILALCDGRHDLAEIETAVGGLVPGSAPAAIRAWLRRAHADRLIGTGPPSGSFPEMDAAELVAVAEHLRAEGDVASAYACQLRAAELAPADPDVWWVLGELAHIQKDRAGARRAYENYLALVPDDAEIRHIVGALSDQTPPARAADDSIVQQYDRFAEFYDENMLAELSYRAPELLCDALAGLLPAAGKGGVNMLDLGCGTGLAGARLALLGGRLVGVDLSGGMVDRARARGVYADLHVAEITGWLAENRRRFDLIVACDVLIHFGDLSPVFRQVSGALEESGLFAFTLEERDGDGWALLDSGRYAHGAAHVLASCAGAGLEVVFRDRVVLRQEYGEAVTGLLFVARREPPTGSLAPGS